MSNLIKLWLIPVIFMLSACEQKNECPCGQIPAGDGCAFEYFYIDNRPGCENIGQPSTYQPEEF